PLAALAAAFALAGLLVAVTYGHPLYALSTLLRGAFGDGRAWGGSLAKSTPILFTGLAIALAFRGGLSTIGVECQLYAGPLTAPAAIYRAASRRFGRPCRGSPAGLPGHARTVGTGGWRPGAELAGCLAHRNRRRPHARAHLRAQRRPRRPRRRRRGARRRPRL